MTEDFSNKQPRLFRLFGSNVLVELPATMLTEGLSDFFEVNDEIQSLSTTCERLAVPHIHVKGPDGGFYCTIPETLKDGGAL